MLRRAHGLQAGDKLKGKANEAGRKAQNAVGNTSQLPSPQDVRAAATADGPAMFPRCTVLLANLGALSARP